MAREEVIGVIKKRPTLADVFSNEKPQQEETEAKPESPRSRYKVINVYLKPEEKEQLRVLAFEERKKIHDLIIEGLDKVLADRGLETITERRIKIL